MADNLFPQMTTVNSDASPERLARLMEALNGYDEGKNAAKYLRDNNITVRFLNRYSAEEWNIIQEDNAKYDPKTKTVLLNPNAPDDRLVSDIPHEAWHAGQEQQGILSAMRQAKNPTQKIALHNIVETAAYTEQAIDGVPLPKDETKVTQDGRTLEDLRLVYEDALKENKTPEAARLDVFKAALRYEAKFENSLHVDIQKMGMKMEDP